MVEAELTANRERIAKVKPIYADLIGLKVVDLIVSADRDGFKQLILEGGHIIQVRPPGAGFSYGVRGDVWLEAYQRHSPASYRSTRSCARTCGSYPCRFTENSLKVYTTKGEAPRGTFFCEGYHLGRL